jgi:[ribosomal protein S5]-alanine N-acetyltransferase
MKQMMEFLRSSSRPENSAELSGNGVWLRAPELCDYSMWAEVRGASRDFLEPWEPAWSDDELSRAAFRRRLKHYYREMREDLGYAFFLFRSGDNALLGGITISGVRRGVSQSCSIGYWIGKSHAGKGYMSSGVRNVIPYVFDTLRLHRLEAACLPSNAASTRLLEKLGFTREGLARRYLKINRQWQDHLLFALLNDDPRP